MERFSFTLRQAHVRALARLAERSGTTNRPLMLRAIVNRLAVQGARAVILPGAVTLACNPLTRRPRKPGAAPRRVPVRSTVIQVYLTTAQIGAIDALQKTLGLSTRSKAISVLMFSIILSSASLRAALREFDPTYSYIQSLE